MAPLNLQLLARSPFWGLKTLTLRFEFWKQKSSILVCHRTGYFFVDANAVRTLCSGRVCSQKLKIMSHDWTPIIGEPSCYFDEKIIQKKLRTSGSFMLAFVLMVDCRNESVVQRLIIVDFHRELQMTCH